MDKDLEILEQLYKGLHLEDTELERAVYLLEMLNKEIKKRCKNEINKRTRIFNKYEKSI